MRHINKRDERVTWVESKNGYERFDRDDVTPSYGHPQANHHGLVPSAMMLRTANGVPGAWGDRKSNTTTTKRHAPRSTRSFKRVTRKVNAIVVIAVATKRRLFSTCTFFNSTFEPVEASSSTLDRSQESFREEIIDISCALVSLPLCRLIE
uniref:Uncharacterized protein n=1 Tax=Vespula pensylvanica TaxID=30213 RepID=A0A834P7F4_VESPE|nr:hypothetical protein H0235_006319 [Vespula pensylvanica]